MLRDMSCRTATMDEAPAAYVCALLTASERHVAPFALGRRAVCDPVQAVLRISNQERSLVRQWVYSFLAGVLLCS